MKAKEEGMLKEVRKRERERVRVSGGRTEETKSWGQKPNRATSFRKNICKDSVAEASWQHQEVIQTTVHRAFSNQ